MFGVENIDDFLQTQVVFLPYCPTALLPLPHCPTAPLPHCLTALLPYCLIAPLPTSATQVTYLTLMIRIPYFCPMLKATAYYFNAYFFYYEKKQGLLC